MGQECRECDCPQGDLPNTKGIDEADPPGHAETAVKWWEWFEMGDVQDICTPSPPGLRESGDVHNVDGDECHQEQVNVDVHFSSCPIR